MEISKLNNLTDLAFYTGVDYTLLEHVLFSIPENELYTEFTIDKKDGSQRVIHSPCNELRIIQKSFLNSVTKDLISVRNVGIHHAFTTGRNICTNAKWHKSKRIVICIDIKDFFPSINFGRILGYLEKNSNFQLKKPLSVQVANLICYKNELPQGAPTSPLFSNLICQILDYRLISVAKKYRMSCTRYADDITFSTNVNYSPDEIDKFIQLIYKEIIRAGFVPNERKTRINYQTQRQTVTGICINKRINVTRDYYKTTRSMAYALYKSGEFTINEKKGTCNQLEGRFQHIYSVDNCMCFSESKNKHTKEDSIKNADKWNSHFVDYSRFLTYKYLWKNNRIMIFCEGKTDHVYIKAALKALSNQYPKLVSVNGNKRQYKIQFFKPKSKLNDVLGLVGEGGKRLKTVLDFYNLNSPKDYHPRRKSILPWIKKHCPVYGAPVIILVDNEFKKDSPLKHIYNSCKKYISDEDYRNLDDDQLKEKLNKRPYFNLVDNLYLLTYRRINNNDTEIEDLLDMDYVNQKLSPRIFDSDKDDKDGYYGKRYLSEFVERHYRSMDFSNFSDFFDSIIYICDDSIVNGSRLRGQNE